MASRKAPSRSIDAPEMEGFGTNRFFETLKKLKRSAAAAQVCPSCGSVRIRFHDSLGGWLLPPVYSCEDCGYVGRVVLELEESDLRKEHR
jgi:predicted RNA-binding Zn-ribbon protein involved in translation (DUF1610 family)